MSSSVDLIPHLREQSTAVNLTTLQKKDPQISRLLFTAKHVVLYHLSAATQQVARQEVEGPLFLVERRVQPFYELIILNRKSITDWRSPVAASMGSAMEVQDKYLHFQSTQQAGLVITLWFHEQPECTNLLDILKRVCDHIARQNPAAPLQPFEPPTIQTQPTAVQQKQHNNNATPQSNAYIQAAAVVATPIQLAHAIPKTYGSPYAPPPPVEYNIALPSNGGKNDRELSQRLNGFLASVANSDIQHTKQYESELRDIESRKRDNARRYAEEERRRVEHEARTRAEAARARATSGATATIQPQPNTMLSHDQLTLLQSFQSSANHAATAAASSTSNLQPPVANGTALNPHQTEGGELERNLAAVKARKAARSHASQAQPSAPQSTLPASLLFAASQATAAPPMPVLSSTGSPTMRPHPSHSPSPTPLASPSGSPNLQPASVNGGDSTAAMHPLLAMLSQSVQSTSPLPPMPNISVLPQSSPYAPSPASASASTTAPTPTLLAPAHFLSATQPTQTNTTPMPPTTNFLTPQSVLSSMTALPTPSVVSSQPPPLVKSKSEFHSYILSLCNDPATLDWMYAKYLTRPNQHPFA